MKKLLLLPALMLSTSVFAQKSASVSKPVDCALIKTENEALKEKIAVYEARLGIGIGGVNTINGNDKLKISFLSCKASKTTHKAVFKFLIQNTDESTRLVIWDYQNSWGSTGAISSFLDEQGKSYPIEKILIGTAQVGYSREFAQIPSKASVQCSIELATVPLSATNFNSVTLSFGKEIMGMNQRIPFVSTFQNVPITWVP